MKVRRAIYKAPRNFRKRVAALEAYLPIGGGAEGRGGSTSGNHSLLDIRATVSVFLATGYWPLATPLEEPQNLKNPQKPFELVCVSWQENALSPGEATPAGPFLWKGLKP